MKMKLHRILITLISALLLASTLIHAEEPEVTPEIVWKSFTTVGSMTLGCLRITFQNGKKI